MTVTYTGEAWRGVLEQTRAYNRAPREPYDMRPYWRAAAYRAFADAPEPIIRAQAFASVLDHIGLHAYDGERLVGSRAGFAMDALPAGVSEADYRRAVEEDKARGQRDFLAGWDHTLADYPTLLEEGIGGRLARIEKARRDHAGSPDKLIALDAMALTLAALSRFVLRHRASAPDADLAHGLDHIAREAPRTLREAMQLVWLVHMGFVAEGRYANALGRMDQYLYPFYTADLEQNVLDREETLDLLCHLWARIEELGEVTNICVGGLTPEGEDATNPLTYLCIEATRRAQSPHTNLSARFHDGSPDAFYRACFECIRTGVGFPAVFNDHVLLDGLAEIGIPDEIARDYCMVGCIETMLPGRQQAWSDSRFNAAACLLKAVRALAAGPAPTWQRLRASFHDEIRRGLAAHAARINAHIARYPVDRFPDPFLSVLTRDCIARGLDVNGGGADFDRCHGICIMGLATVADSLAAIRKLVFDEHRVTLEELVTALDADFEGYEPLRRRLLNSGPKYGNADPYVDDIAAWVVRLTGDACLEHRVCGGGRFVAAMAANVQNLSAGRDTGATPDGRKAGMPLSDSASPTSGRDLHGPTAFLHSVARPDYHRVITGSVINMKFEPAHFAGEYGARAFTALMRYFVSERIPELQFNFTGTQTLQDAQRNPELYDSLVVRVSGFSAHFTRLSREVQSDIIRRRAHGTTGGEPWRINVRRPMATHLSAGREASGMAERTAERKPARPGRKQDNGTGMVFDIQRFSLHNGAGIRTTVFLKGCPLKCAWCQNPESIGASVQIAHDARRCIGCGACVSACSAGAHTLVGGGHIFCRETCIACGACVAACPALGLEKAGRKMRVAEVLRVVEQDKPFYRDSGGGLTVSGGEPLAQAAFTAALLQGARAAGIHTAVQTSGAGSEANVRAVADLCDLVLFDIKAAPSAYPHLVGSCFARVEASLRIFAQGGRPIRLRLPLVPGVNDTDEHFANVAEIVRTYPSIQAVDILPYHRLGTGKYARFGIPPPATEYNVPDGSVRDRWRVKFAELGVSEGRPCDSVVNP